MMKSWCVSIMLPGPGGGTCRMKRDGDVRVILYRGKNQVVPGIMTDLVTEIAHHRLVESPRPNHVGDSQIDVVDKPRHRESLLVCGKVFRRRRNFNEIDPDAQAPKTLVFRRSFSGGVPLRSSGGRPRPPLLWRFSFGS